MEREGRVERIESRQRKRRDGRRGWGAVCVVREIREGRGWMWICSFG